MPWIPHLMVLDDDPRVLESLVPGFVLELARVGPKRDGRPGASERGLVERSKDDSADQSQSLGAWI